MYFDRDKDKERSQTLKAFVYPSPYETLLLVIVHQMREKKRSGGYGDKKENRITALRS